MLNSYLGTMKNNFLISLVGTSARIENLADVVPKLFFERYLKK
jgi:hypothetical protein